MYKKDTVNVIMPVYNEENTLQEIITRVLEQKVVDKLIIVNDSSKDKSLDIIKNLSQKDKRIIYITNKSNMGKGYSVRKGLELVKSGIVIIQDADLEYYPEDYGKMIPLLKEDTFVLGTRIRNNQKGHNYLLGAFVNSCLTAEFNLFYSTRMEDINTCYKVFKKEMISESELKQNGFLLDLEILMILIRKGYKMAEVNVRYTSRTFKEGKKITAKDAIKQFGFIISNRLS
ncbi:MAG: glycosyltransferase family 2 protein [Candidatus Micrarchaeaceae archaeon]